ncbi:hypothetical protein A6R68_01531, partial [Neotoma lepida]
QTSKHNGKCLCCEYHRERGFGYKDFCFIELFQDLCVRVLTSHTITALKSDENFIYRSWHLVHGKHRTKQKFPVFHLIAKTERLRGKPVFFGRVKDGMSVLEARKCKASKTITIANDGQL